jgi:hypothetical protein
MKLGLKELFLEVLREFDSDGKEKVIELPNQNFTVSLFRKEQKIVFMPQDHSSIPMKVREYIYDLKGKFNISRINSLDDEQDPSTSRDDNLRGAFEVIVDPREDFERVVEYLRGLMIKDSGRRT